VTPNWGDGAMNDLYGVSCRGADCWAVGRADRGDGHDQGLALHGSGGAWTLVDLPRGVDALKAVTCVSASDCWAAGAPFGSPAAPRSVLVHWDGTAWTKVHAPNRPLGAGKVPANNLFGLACASASACWAVGQYSNGPNKQTLVLQYGSSACPDDSAPPCPVTTTSTTQTSSTSPSATTTTDTGAAGGLVNNVAPVIDRLLAAPGIAVIGHDSQVALTGAAHDDNGAPDIQQVSVQVNGPGGAATQLATLTQDGSDTTAITFAAASPIAAGTPTGTYQVDTVAVDTAGAQSPTASTTFTVLPPPAVRIDYTDGASRLDFGSFDPGATHLVSTNAFVVSNQLHADKQFWFDMTDFACTRGTVPVQGNAKVNLGHFDGATFVTDRTLDYAQSTIDFGTLSDGSTVSVQLELLNVPKAIAGTCTASFGLYHT
jgi:hypothetical protein